MLDIIIYGEYTTRGGWHAQIIHVEQKMNANPVLVVHHCHPEHVVAMWHNAKGELTKGTMTGYDLVGKWLEQGVNYLKHTEKEN